MYDPITSAALFVLLVPGVAITLPPGGGIWAALLHAVVFYIVQSYAAPYVPWWGIWVAMVLAVGFRLWMSRTPPSSF
jgi:hypothetical protein